MQTVRSLSDCEGSYRVLERRADGTLVLRAGKAVATLERLAGN